MNKGFPQEKQDWNLNFVFSQEIGRLITEVNKAATLDINSWNLSLRILYRNIHGYEKVNLDHMRQVDEKMRLINTKLTAIKTTSTKDSKNRMEKETLDLLDQVHTELTDEFFSSGLAKFSVTKKEGLEIYES